MPSRMAFFRAFFSVDPAHAGMNPNNYKRLATGRSGPRACGDEPAIQPVFTVRTWWTPRMGG